MYKYLKTSKLLFKNEFQVAKIDFNLFKNFQVTIQDIKLMETGETQGYLKTSKLLFKYSGKDIRYLYQQFKNFQVTIQGLLCCWSAIIYCI